MPNDWYCQIQGAVYGPLNSHDLKRMAEQGKLGCSDLVKKTEMGKWIPAQKIKGLTLTSVPKLTAGPAGTDPPPERKCPACKAVLTPGAVLCVRCGLDLRTGKKVQPSALPPKQPPLLGAGIVFGAIVLCGLGIAVYLFVFQVRREGKVASNKNKQSSVQSQNQGQEPAPNNVKAPAKAPQVVEGGNVAAMRIELADLRARRKNKGWGGKRPNTDEAAQLLMVERVSQIVKTKELQGWMEAVRTIGANVDGGALVAVLANYDPLFNEGRFHQDVSAQYRLRIKQLPKQSLEHWGEAFRQIDPQFYNNAEGGLVLSALLLVEVDRFFGNEQFREAEAIRYLTRLRSIPHQAINTWAANEKHDGYVVAAIFMMQIDSLFENDQFQPSRLDSVLRILNDVKENNEK